MLGQYKKLENKGFTIIEVMIVLAIAGLILLIVFLAVPALERSARNTQRKNDVSNILAGYNTATSNNNSTPPSCISYANPTLTWFAGGAVPTCSGSQLEETKLGYYTKGVVASAATASSGKVYLNSSPGTGTITLDGGVGAAAKYDYVEIVYGDTCSGTSAVAGSANQVSVLYELETGSSTYTLYCQDS
jgi:prepilin-type N-terminal cleavage/methylation domain-containing protein